MKLGILALQGCVQAHVPHFEALGFKCGQNLVLVKTKQDLESCDALVIPGGESSTMLKLLKIFGMWDALKNFVTSKPVWGVCAGAILLARKVTHPEQESLSAMDVDVQRNAYGRQLESFQCELEGYEVSFIRAPLFEKSAASVNILYSHQEHMVGVQQGLVMATSFHPELNTQHPSPFHRDFVELCKNHCGMRENQSISI